MTDLTGSNNRTFDATELGTLAIRETDLGGGALARLDVADSTGLLERLSAFSTTPGDDPTDFFVFNPSGLDSVTIGFDADGPGDFTNFLSIVPFSGVTAINGVAVATWFGGDHASSGALNRQIVTENAEDLLDALKTQAVGNTADASAATFANDPETVSATWTLNGQPVIIEVAGYQLDDLLFRGVSSVNFSEVSYTFSIEPLARSFAPDVGINLLFRNALQTAETHVGEDGLDLYDFGYVRDQMVVQQIDDTTLSVATARFSSSPDTLIDIERIKLTDGYLAFDVDGTAGQAYRLYQAAFDRQPDDIGLGHWIKGYDAGNFDLVEMADAFLQSEEFTIRNGAVDTLGDAEFLTLLYANVLDRDPDEAGFAFWRGQQDAGLGRPEILQFFSESVENYANVAGDVSDGIFYV